MMPASLPGLACKNSYIKMRLLVWFCVISLYCCGVLSYPTTTQLLLPGPGPRPNETGRFRFEDRDSPGTYYHCQFCPSRALSDDTYAHMQAPACFPTEGLSEDEYWNLRSPWEKKYNKFAICNTGGVPGCGEPNLNHTSEYEWNCDRGYSGKFYSVYFTCKLMQKDTNAVTVQLYCNESLVWHEDKNELGEVNADAAVTEGPDQITRNSQILIIACSSSIVLAVVCIITICIIMKKKKWGFFKDKDAARRQPPVQHDEVDIHNSASTIGTCSLVRNGSVADGQVNIPLLPQSEPVDANHNMRDSGRSTATCSKKDSCVGTEPLIGAEAFDNSIEIPPAQQHSSLYGQSLTDRSLTFVKQRIEETSFSQEPDSEMSGANSQTAVKELVPVTDVSGGPDSVNREPAIELVPMNNEPASISREPGSRKISQDDPAALKRDDGPQVKVFYENPNNTGKRSTPIDNDGGIYEIPVGCTYYIVPSSSNGEIRAFSVVRKDDGDQPYRGRAQPEMGLTFMHLISNATQDDGGVFSWTVVLETGEEYRGVIQISIDMHEHEMPQCQSEGRLEPIGSEHGDNDSAVLRSSRSSTESTDDNASIPGRHKRDILHSLSSSGRSDTGSEHVQGNCKINDLNRESNVSYPGHSNLNSNRNISDPASVQILDPNSILNNSMVTNEPSGNYDSGSAGERPVRGEGISIGNVPYLNISTFDTRNDNHSKHEETLNVTNTRAAQFRHGRVQTDDSRTEVDSVEVRARFDHSPPLDPDTIEEEWPSGSRPTPTGATGSTCDTFSETHSDCDDENDERHNTSRKEYANSNNDQPMSDPTPTRELNASPASHHPSGTLSLPTPDTLPVVKPELIGADHVTPGLVPQGQVPGPVPQEDSPQPGDVHGEMESRPSQMEGRATTPPLAISAQNVPCLTPLSDIAGDDKFITDLGSKGKPQDWVDLKENLKVPNGLKFGHRNGTTNNGLNGTMSDLKCILVMMSQEQMKVGDIVRHFCGVGSDSPDIVDFCVDKCTKHVHCVYCMNLRDDLKQRKANEFRSPGNS